MYVTNNRIVDWYLIYKDAGGNTKRQIIDAGATVEVTDLTDVADVLLDPHLRRVRGINDNTNLNRDHIEEGFEFRLTLTGSTL